MAFGCGLHGRTQRRRLTAHAHSRYALDTRYHDYMSCSPLVEIVIGGSRGNSPAVREGLQVREAILGIHAAGPAGINYTTRECTCLFRCLAYYAKQRPKPLSVIHMIMSINRLHGTTLWSQIWRVQFDIGIWISSDSPSGSTYLGYSRYVQHVVVSWTSRVGDKGKCNVSWHVYSRVCL